MTSTKHCAIDEPGRHGHENASKNDVAEEVCSLRYAHEASGNTAHCPSYQKGRRPLRDDQSQGVEWHEDRCRFAADKGTVVGALIGRDYGRGERLGAPKLDNLLGPCAAPMILQHDVCEDPGSHAQTYCQK